MKNIFMTIILLAVSAGAAELSISLHLDPAAVILSQQDSWTVVRLAAAPEGTVVLATDEPGEPLLPVLSGNVLIPPDARLKSVHLKVVEWQELGTGFKLYPVQPMRPLSRFNSVPFVAPKAEIYRSDLAYPAEMVQAVPPGSKAGFRLSGFLFCPFAYHPASGRLRMAQQAVLTVEYEAGSVPVAHLSPGQLMLAREDVARLVVNHEDIERFAPATVESDGPELDVAVITSSTLMPAVSSFAGYLRRKGYFTEVFATESIYVQYPGRDNPEKIRNLLKELFVTRGLKYVVLAGDVQHVPCRTGYLPYSPYNVPADLYYSDLDGTWDFNNNGQFGEYSYTSYNPDSVDLFSDIVVGRLPLDDASHLANFLRKDTLYERHPDTTYLHRVLLPFEALWSNIDYYGRIVNRNIAIALSGSGAWTVDSVYNMSPSQCVASINSGRHLFHFAGHGSVSAFGSTFSTSNLSSLTNTTMPVIVNSMACDCGNFDQQDGLGEQFINATAGGAVSTCLNARYGWGAPPNMGPSENLCMEFYNNYLRGCNQGRAYALAKDFFRNAAFSQMTYRWSVYEWTLQGDPTMLLWRTAPKGLLVSCPDTIRAEPQVLAVEVRYAEGQPAAGARVAILHGDELIGRGITGGNGRAQVVLREVGDTWSLILSVTAQDGAPVERRLAVRSGNTGPLLVYRDLRVDDENGRLDPGDEANVYITIANDGNQAAGSATAILHACSPLITLIDSVSSYPATAPGDTASGEPFRLRVSPDCPHGERVELELMVNADSAAFISQLEVVVGMPYARAGIWAVHDTADFVAAVCANGGIGTTSWRGEGLGFIYPKNHPWSSSAMMHGALLLGVRYPDTFWVADNYYGTPWQVTAQDFAIVDSIRPVLPPEFGDQEFVAVFSDARHSQPKRITITQRSFVSARTQHKDFMVLEYRIHNNDTMPVTNLWAGVACDFRTAFWNQNDSVDYPGVDTVRNLAYVRAQPETLALGVRPIYPPEASGFANCIFHQTCIQDGFTKREKMDFLDGTQRAVSGTNMGNWHALVSCGPFTILPGDSQIVAFVIVGGRTVAQMSAASDTAFNWYEPQVGMREAGPGRLSRLRIQVRPKVFSRNVTISYIKDQPGSLEMRVYNSSGRLMEQVDIPDAGVSGNWHWVPRVSERGIFFLKVNGQTEKVVRIE
ncbi:MAG: C25 family cysteine peptidase [candidate division WOR-3 bacterium]